MLWTGLRRKWQLLLLPTDHQENPSAGCPWLLDASAATKASKIDSLQSLCLQVSCFQIKDSGACDKLAKPTSNVCIPVSKESGNLNFLNFSLMKPDPSGCKFPKHSEAVCVWKVLASLKTWQLCTRWDTLKEDKQNFGWPQLRRLYYSDGTQKQNLETVAGILRSTCRLGC